MHRRLLVILGALALFVAACSEAEPETEAADDTTTTAADADDGGDDADGGGDADDGGDGDADDETGDDDTGDDGPAEGTGDSVVERHAGSPWYLGTVPDLPVAADGSAEPIKVGLINQEDGNPAGSYPEMRFAAGAAINFINTELGGVDGRPLELVPCANDNFTEEKSRSCAQDLVAEGVVALVGGLDVMASGSLPVLEGNGIPMIGGIPAGLPEQRSDIAFAFSGGTAGAMAAMLSHAKDNGAESAMIAHGDFESFNITAQDFAAKVGESLGLEVTLVPFPILATDFLPVFNQALDTEADAVIVAAADAACISVMQGWKDFEIPSQLYLVGACAAEEIIDNANGSQDGVIFSGEGPPVDVDTEGDIFEDAIDTYAEGFAHAAGTVGFRGMMNLYSLLVDLSPDDINSAALLDLVRSAQERPSFWGHPYTCDGNQIPGLPSLCAPQQTLFEIPGEFEDLTFISDWIDPVPLYQDALG
ncbi:MAG: ABC transporter substrate-binding protein [Actinomycetota bacterium]